MKNLILIVGIISAGLFINGCTEENPLISTEELVVVWAFIYAEQPVTDIRLTSTLTLDTDSSAAPSINDAKVILIKNGQEYQCDPSPGDSGYYHYSGSDLTITAGDEFAIEIEHRDQFLSSQTVVPDTPVGVSISSSVMEVPNFSDRGSMRAWRSSEDADIVLTWENDDDSWYYVAMQNIDDNPVPIDSWFAERMKDFVFPPVNGNTFSIRLPLITHLGLHRITVYKVNQEYLDLYESRNQDSRDLNEPLTNIENGLGVFSAFNSASITLNVVQQ